MIEQQRLPAWSLLPIGDELIPKIEDFYGKPLLILFFYLGCPGCKGRAIPFANRIVYENSGIEVMGIHTRFEGRSYADEEIREAIEQFHIRFPVYRDMPESKTYHTYHAGGTPHWVLIDSEGRVAQSIFGSDPNNALLRLDYRIKEMLEND